MMSSAKNLLDIFEYLPDHDQQTLLDFAEFLKSRAPAVKSLMIEVVDIARPDSESVIAAIKRLTETYPMIDRSSMFSDTSDLMMQHTLNGRSAVDVIDEMEILFARKLKDIQEECE